MLKFIITLEIISLITWGELNGDYTTRTEYVHQIKNETSLITHTGHHRRRPTYALYDLKPGQAEKLKPGQKVKLKYWQTGIFGWQIGKSEIILDE